MDFIDRIRELSTQIPKQLEHIKTEEGTKNALIMPFITALGYNVFDPTEVTPEYIADVGIKKGEKVDYVILREGKPVILFECKAATANLDDMHASQLYRYFSVTAARFGILTNGISYRFFTDLEDPNKMDAKPFFEFNMLDIREPMVEELKKFTKSAFDLDLILTTATELKYTREIKRIIAEEMRAPSDDFIRLFVKQVYSGHVTQTVREQFAQLIRQAWAQFVNDLFNDKLKAALAQTEASPTPSEPSPVPATEEEKPKIVTTQDELDAYYIVKSILREIVDAKRVVLRDAQSYCNVLFDDTNRKPICRFYFSAEKKSISIVDVQKQEEKIPIETVDDIYKYADRLKAVTEYYAKS